MLRFVLFWVTLLAWGIVQALNSVPSKRYFLSICSTFKNEGKYFKEWIEYHRLIGIDHFYLYNLGSSDNYKNILRPYLADGLITLIQWPDLGKHQSDGIWMLSTQIPAYENAIQYRAAKETKWLVFVDVDEFLVPHFANDLRQVLEKYESYPGIILTSDFFDAANQYYKIPKRRLIIENMELIAPPKQKIEREIVKTIFKPNEVQMFMWPPYQFIFKNGKEAKVIRKNDLSINRYINKRGGDFFSHKPQISKNHQMTEEEVSVFLENGYEIEDPEGAISRFVPEVIKRMGL